MKALQLEDQLAKLDLSRLDGEQPQLIVFDEQDENIFSDRLMAVVFSGNGWLQDQDRHSHRFKRLGQKQFIDESRNKHQCEACGDVFFSRRALSSHRSHCRQPEEMTTEQQATRHKTREANAAKNGRNRLPVEQVKIATVNGERIKAVAEFKYLGTIVAGRGVAKEVNKRLRAAASTFARLGKIWEDRRISLKLKCTLYFAMVMAVLLYNGECWAVSAHDLSRLEGFHFRCLRRMTRTERGWTEGDQRVDKASHEVYRISKVPWIAEMLREKRLRWFGHLAREKEGEPARDMLWAEKEAARPSVWWAQLKEDIAAKKISSVESAFKKARNRERWRAISSCCVATRRSGIRVIPRPQVVRT